jgi:hypothetical protein
MIQREHTTSIDTDRRIACESDEIEASTSIKKNT